MIMSNVPNISSMGTVKAKVEIYLSSILVQTCTCSDILQDFKVSREGDTSKFFGFGVSHNLEINLIDLYRTLYLTKYHTFKICLGDGENWDCPYPTFFIGEVSRDEDNNTITATAHDSLYNASNYTITDLALTAPYTLETVVEAIATKLGVECVIPPSIAAQFNLSYSEGANFNGNENLRTILDQIAEATQTIYFIDYQNKLRFKMLDRDGVSMVTVGKSDYYKLNTQTSRTLVRICSTTELGDNIDASTGNDGVTQYIRENPFLNMRDDVANILDNAIAKLGGIEVNQFNCDWDGDYLLEIGDKITLTQENGDVVNSYLLSDSAEYDGTYGQVSEWTYKDADSETHSNPTTIGDKINQTFAKVDKIEKNITLYVSDVLEEVLPDKIDEATGELVEDVAGLKSVTTKNTENISTLQLTTDGIKNEVSSLTETTTRFSDDIDVLQQTQTAIVENVSSLIVSAEGITTTVSNIQSTLETKADIEEIEAIEKTVETKVTSEQVQFMVTTELSNGVDKVTTTSKRYTFDDTGLNISADGNAVSTMITEEGMTVSRNDEEVLIASDDGVLAKDLKASSYLEIGGRTRFQNFETVDGKPRTACFWIGG